MRIAVDAMGGDLAPQAVVEGAVQAFRQYGHQIILVGDPLSINEQLVRLDASGLGLKIEQSDSIVGMDESPAQACRQKPNSSIMVSARLVAEGKADAFVSAGNSGASMAAALWHFHRLPGVSRPAITVLFPTLNGFCVMADAGANVDCKPKHLLQFAVMGSVYMKCILNRPNPRIGLLSIGEEPSKGNELTLAAAELLKNYVPNFIGNVEGRDIPKGMADVVVCDGFVGNVVLKFAEGLAESIILLVKEGVKERPVAKLGGLFLQGLMKDLKKKLDYAEYGGAPLLGVNGACIISHGKSNPKAIRNAIRAAAEFVEKKTNDHIRSELQHIHPDIAIKPPSRHATLTA
jgi:glycerol-3-phosphate acyltransferase PlsX